MVMTDPVTAGKALLEIGKLAMTVKRKLDELGPTARMLEADAVAGREWRERRAFRADQRITRLETEADDAAAFKASVESMLSDLQFERLQRSMEFEAAREATDERRVLLAELAGGLSTPEFSINEKARIERTVRQLDGEDIIFLHRLATLADADFAYDPRDSNSEEHQRSFYDARKRLEVASTRSLSKASLIMAGCIAENSGFAGGPVLDITALGSQVLTALASYVSEKAVA
jgi:hypothetical protein